MEMDLFDGGEDEEGSPFRPLADRMRPQRLGEVVGQDHVAAPGKILHSAITNDRVFSTILWGPPGCGKTTLAGIIAKETSSHFMQLSAVLSGVKDIRAVIETAKEQRRIRGRRTLVFVDEIHRFNKAQQDAFLHHVETGAIVLVGATTENPSFEVIPALVSRCRVITLNRLGERDIVTILERAATDPVRGLGSLGIIFSAEALNYIAATADGDVRAALATLETIGVYASARKGAGGKTPSAITPEDVAAAVEKKALRYDKSGEEHFNLISAFHKSLRGSDPDGAIYWLERMMAAGEDPLYLIRRMVRFATEDVGVADPGALGVALNALEAYRFLGSPEGDDALFQAAVYLATAPKSNSVYMAHKRVKKKVEETGSLPVPLHVRNAPTRLMKDMGYGQGYQYAHDHVGGYFPQEYLPEGLRQERFYLPTDRGYEAVVKQRLEAWIALKKTKKS
ncbi:putative ATPase [Desulforapulum autotrophicum HRM2]|uniref:Replication-associated recombination protein A n=2 Tax=Desulforapulum autotrophicum TaxID=2296 RepID=C0QA04_DESAH|nr:putative ATPase [Desulforapulum autotrophicum HRM2]